MDTPTPRQATAAALALGLGAAGLTLLALRAPAGLRVPPTIVLLLAGVVAAAALSAWATARRRERQARGWIVLLLAGFAITGAWIAVGPGERVCVERSFAGRTHVVGSGCRVAFGTGALLTGALVVVAVRHWRRARVDGAAEPDA